MLNPFKQQRSIAERAKARRDLMRPETRAFLHSVRTTSYLRGMKINEAPPPPPNHLSDAAQRQADLVLSYFRREATGPRVTWKFAEVQGRPRSGNRITIAALENASGSRALVLEVDAQGRLYDQGSRVVLTAARAVELVR